MTALGALAEELGVSQRTLRRAVHQGMLRGARRGREVAVPIGERRYARRAWPLISALRQILRTRHDIRLAVLFGSASAGTDRPDSDVDILVAMHDPTLERAADLEEKLANRIHRSVDLVLLEDARRDDSFLADVVETGRVLVDRDGLGGELRARATELRSKGRANHQRELRAALAGVDRMLGR